jgi:Putative prokaryotic signal transducing protein
MAMPRNRLAKHYTTLMKPLYSAQHAAEAHLIRGYLEAQGIHAIVRGEFLASGIGDLPADVCKVWVIDDADFTRADQCLREFLRGEAARAHAHEQWQCTRCNETLEGQFTTCWNCGGVRTAHEVKRSP